MIPYCPYWSAVPYFRYAEVAVDSLPPEAAAVIKGGPLAPGLEGVATFKSAPGGVTVCVDVIGLPAYQPAKDGKKPVGPHGFHIHDGKSCEVGNPAEPFKAAGEHWNPTGQPHGNHDDRGNRGGLKNAKETMQSARQRHIFGNGIHIYCRVLFRDIVYISMAASKRCYFNISGSIHSGIYNWFCLLQNRCRDANRGQASN